MNTTNIAAPISFSLDRLTAFADDANLAHHAKRRNDAGISEQVWVGLVSADNRVAFADSVRDAYDEHVATLAESKSAKERQRADILKGWKKGYPLAQRLSSCRKIVAWCAENPEAAGQVWTKETLGAALSFVNKALKEAKAPASGGDPDEDTIKLAGRMAIVVEADTEAGAAILADLRAYLAAASESDRLAVLVELESIVNG